MPFVQPEQRELIRPVCAAAKRDTVREIEAEQRDAARKQRQREKRQRRAEKKRLVAVHDAALADVPTT